MQIVESEISKVVTGTPDYESSNPIVRMIRNVESIELAAGLEHYLPESMQYLFPVSQLALYGPSDSATTDPRGQENKQDFQKQNIADFQLGDTQIARGYACAGDWEGSFIRVSYSGSPFSVLGQEARSRGMALPQQLQVFLKVGKNMAPGMILVPWNPITGRYELEIWGYPKNDLEALLDEKGKASIASGRLITLPTLVHGLRSDFWGETFSALRDAANAGVLDTDSPSGINLLDLFPDHTLHPVLPLRIEIAWGFPDGSAWDSNNGKNYAYEFNMTFRGWNNYLATGVSRHPHGGIGFLEYRNLLSNYFGYEEKRQTMLGPAWENELGRDLDTWNHDANTWNFQSGPAGPKASGPKRERFLAVDYMDLHVLTPGCGIGIHRHRDNQEIFFLLEGKGLMVVGDWCQFPHRERAFEIRFMSPGDMTICKTGQLHALYNLLDEPAKLLMFGGYD